MTGWLAAYLASVAFTATISGVQIHHGCHERNPLAPRSVAHNIEFKALVSVPYATLFEIALHHPRAKVPARFMAVLGTSANVAVGIHDARQHCGGR